MLLLEALALVLIIEGLIPLLAPTAWKRFLLKVQAMPENQLRIMGGTLVGVGALIIGLI